MNREQYLLLKLIEELGEVSKNAAKAMQFGGTDKEPGQGLTNFQRLYMELDDVQASVNMLNAEPDSVFDYNPCRVNIENKTTKVEHFYQYSKDLGKVGQDTAELLKLSVTNIMLDVVPGDGSGHEVYAKNVGQVEEALSKGYMEVEDLQGRVETLRAQLARTREVLVVGMGDKSPFVKMALADIDEVLK